MAQSILRSILPVQFVREVTVVAEEGVAALGPVRILVEVPRRRRASLGDSTHLGDIRHTGVSLVVLRIAVPDHSSPEDRSCWILRAMIGTSELIILLLLNSMRRTPPAATRRAQPRCNVASSLFWLG